MTQLPAALDGKQAAIGFKSMAIHGGFLNDLPEVTGRGYATPPTNEH
jgi:hypothetical protein